MKTLKANHLGERYLDQYPKITVKSLFREVEKELRGALLKVKLGGLEIISSPGSYWGYRRWFKCPMCSSKAFALYDINGSLKCRKCSGLFYKSQKRKRLLEQKVSKGEETCIIKKNHFNSI